MKYAAIVEKSATESDGWGGSSNFDYLDFVEFKSRAEMEQFVDSQYRSINKLNYRLIQFDELSVKTSFTIENLATR